MRVLGLFRQRQGSWTVEEIAREMAVSTSSAYRDVQDLCRAGFLNPVTGAGYILGPAFIEYDRLTRQGDPLIQAASAPMRHLLARTTQKATAILCRRYRDTVMCVHQEQGSSPHPITAYERGSAMPLFIGASSKAVMANMEARALKRIYLDNEEEIRRSTRAATWKEFNEELRAIQRAGYAMTIGEVAAGRIGIAAPVFAAKQVVAGVSLVLSADDVPDGKIEAFARAVREAAEEVSEFVLHSDMFISR